MDEFMDLRKSSMIYLCLLKYVYMHILCVPYHILGDTDGEDKKSVYRQINKKIGKYAS